MNYIYWDSAELHNFHWKISFYWVCVIKTFSIHTIPNTIDGNQWFFWALSVFIILSLSLFFPLLSNFIAWDSNKLETKKQRIETFQCLVGDKIHSLSLNVEKSLQLKSISKSRKKLVIDINTSDRFNWMQRFCSTNTRTHAHTITTDSRANTRTQNDNDQF